MINIQTFYAYNDLRNYSYLLYDDQSGLSWAIDPFDSGKFIDFIKGKGLKLKGVLNTHQHWDHIRGNKDLMEAFGAPVTSLKSSQKIPLDRAFSLEALDTPGHTLDHQVFMLKEEGRVDALFSGDTLFNSGIGNCRNGGDVNLLYQTTEKLRSLPKATRLYPGHDYRRRNLEFALSVEPENKLIREGLQELPGKTEELPPVTLEEELGVNPFLRLESDELKQIVLKTSNPLPDPDESKRQLFRSLRALRDQW